MLLRTTAIALLTTALAPAQQPITYPDLLRDMTDLDWLWSAPRAGERCIQFSSYDRGSEKGLGLRETKPWDPKGWYANHDRGFYLREEQRDGHEEFVMADVQGPGAIVRIWSANPAGTLHFYIDGASSPTWSVDFKALLSGSVEPLVEPLAGMRARGGNCHAPWPFARHLKLTCSQGDQYYQVNVRLFPPGSPVEAFHPDQLEQHAPLLARLRERLGDGPALPAGLEVTRAKGTIAMDGDPADPADWARRAWPLEGPLVIREIRLKLRPGMDSSVPHHPLRRLRLRLDLEGRTTIDVPVCDFFGSAPGFKPYQGYPLGVDEDGTGRCRFPIPIRGRGTLTLLADGPLPAVDYELELATQKQPVPEEALTFRASWHIARQIRTRPFSDFRVLNARGPGRFVGCMLMVANPSRFWWGEGDEKFFVDGESFPSTFGTGTEDYFGYAWGDRTLFASPYHAQTQCDGPGNAGYICLDRFQIPDAVPFQTTFLFDMEIWHWKDVHVDYASTAYWYGPAAATAGLPSVPGYYHREAGAIRPEEILAVKGALEGESLEILSRSAGKTETPLMGWYSAERWSNERHLFWKEAAKGDRLALGLPVAKAGRYRLQAVFTRARDYAIVQVWLDGRKLGKPLDLFSPYVVQPTERLDLGTLDLGAGQHRLELEIVGKNERAVAGFVVGLDYLRLAPPE